MTHLNTYGDLDRGSIWVIPTTLVITPSAAMILPSVLGYFCDLTKSGLSDGQMGLGHD